MSQCAKFLATILIGSSLGVGGSCYADSLIGSVISADYRYPNTATVYTAPGTNTSTNPFTVGAGVDTVISVEGVTFLNVDFSAHSLLITFDTLLPLNPAQGNPTWDRYVSQNGPAFTVVSGTPFSSISSVVASNSGPISAFLSSGTLFLDWRGMTYQTGDTVTVSFDQSVVPVPAALPLFAGGLGLLAWMGRRRRGLAGS